MIDEALLTLQSELEQTITDANIFLGRANELQRQVTREYRQRVCTMFSRDPLTTKSGKRSRGTAAKYNAIISALKAGKTLDEVGKKFGLSKCGIHRAVYGAIDDALGINE